MTDEARAIAQGYRGRGSAIAARRWDSPAPGAHATAPDKIAAAERRELLRGVHRREPEAQHRQAHPPHVDQTLAVKGRHRPAEITAPDLNRLHKRVEARALSLHLRGEESGKHIRGEDLRCHASNLPSRLNERAVFGDDFL
jgi:hypothetical protein